MFSGSIVALVTPFKKNFEIDLDAYGRLIDRQIEQGTHGLVPCGCTGEAATLSHDEQKRCIRFTVERAAGRVPVIAGTGSNNTHEAVGLTRYAKEVGAAAALLITPYYNKPTPAGQIAHFTAVAKAADIPNILYNVPGRTGTNMLPQTVAELSKIDNIVAIKEAGGSVDQVSHIISLCGITVLSGDDSLTLPMMAVGAKGVISVAANVAPAKTAKMCSSFLDGDIDAARRLHHELFGLFKGLFIETNPMPVKAALAHMGLIENILRMPLTPMLPDKFAQLEVVLKQLGV
ncbi:MAG TPA: 4-hydroxy-tetrahydrodipicolinate synthase [Candidatus Bathyarchaeia archaeon]|nr:4-hydroxy-tetrahydrodipicolinate synthase [Candidatus Bathyarchaeia archaeon]